MLFHPGIAAVRGVKHAATSLDPGLAIVVGVPHLVLTRVPTRQAVDELDGADVLNLRCLTGPAVASVLGEG